MKRAVLLVMLAVSACTSTPEAVRPTPSVTAPSSTTLPENADEWTLRFRLLEQYRPLFYCDPDEHPVGVDEQEVRRRAREWYAESKGSAEANAILTELRMKDPLDDSQILSAYRQHKRLRAVLMEPAGAGFRFALSVGEKEPVHIEGTIGRSGRVVETKRTRTQASCPICLEPGTRIGAPAGSVPAEAIRRGMLVWTLDAHGSRVAAPVRQIVRRRVAGPHAMMQVRLTDGRTVIAAAAHPTVDGAPLSTLRRGHPLDGARVVDSRPIWSQSSYTYDLLPAGPTGAYMANGIWLGSTLSRRSEASRTRVARSA